MLPKDIDQPLLVDCPYCKGKAKLVMGDQIYPTVPHLHSLYYWLCMPCGAYVGTHSNSPKHAPLGRLANHELRKAKQRAHSLFDMLWQSGQMTRKGAYFWMSEVLNLDKKQAHIGKFNVQQCNDLIIAIQRLPNSFNSVIDPSISNEHTNLPPSQSQPAHSFKSLFATPSESPKTKTNL